MYNMVKYTCDICGCNEFISTDPEEHEVCMCGYCGKYYTFDQLFKLKINDGPAVTRDFLIKKFGMDIYAGELFDYHRMNETVVVPNVVRKIKNFCFENHTMKKLIIPSGVNEIEYCAFELCENLTEVIIYEGLTAIGDYAF